MELAKLPVLATLVAMAFLAADAAMYAQRLEIVPGMGETKTHHFMDSRLQVHGFHPDGDAAMKLCHPKTKDKLYGILNNYEAKVWVKYPCRGSFVASFSSYKPLEAHPGPIAVVGTPLSMEEATIMTQPENNNFHNKKKVLLKTELYPQKIWLSKMTIFSLQCKEGETFGISQSRWKAEIWAIWPCRGTFSVSYDAKYPLSPIPKPGEEQQICQLELVMTSDKDKTTEMDGDVVSVELSRLFRGNDCNKLGQHFTIKDNSFTVRFQYHCVAYFKVCYNDTPKECFDVEANNINNKPLPMSFCGLILSVNRVKKYYRGTCGKDDMVVKDNEFTVHSTACAGVYNVCILKRIATPNQPVCPKPKDDDEECVVIKGVNMQITPTRWIPGANEITCATLIKDTSNGKCNCPVTGNPLYKFTQTHLESSNKYCAGDFKVCYKKFPHKGAECPAKAEEHDLVCVDTYVRPGRKIEFKRARSVNCVRLSKLMHHSSIKVRCFDSRDNPLFAYRPYRGRHYVQALSSRCAGLFRVCYKPACQSPLYELVDGKCIYIDRKSSSTYAEAALKCNANGGKLLNIRDPFAYFQQMKNDTYKHKFGGSSFFIGGSMIFADATRSPGAAAISSQLSRTPAFLPNLPFMPIKNWHKIKELLNIQDKPHNSILEILRRYTGYATIEDLSRDSPFSDRCLSMNFGHEGLEFVSCQERQHFICEQSYANSRDMKWTPWTNLDKSTTHQYESLKRLQYLHSEGKVNLKPLTYCKTPVYMECRNARFPMTFYNPYMNYIGLNFEPNCINNMFYCNGRNQAKKVCPDVEFRFACPPDEMLTCQNQLFITHCRTQNKECRDTSFGPECFEKVIEHTGEEVIGERMCSLHNKEYVMKQCVTRGDPMVRSFDGKVINDFNSNAGSYVFFDSRSIKSDYMIPDFRVVIHNAPLASYVNKVHTREFEVTINGTTYAFKKDNGFEVDGLKKNYIDFSDDNIEIVVQNKGSSPKININTQFCMQLVWDSRMSLYLRLPEEFRTIKSGLCGNFNGNPSDDLVLPAGKKPVSQKDFTSYFMVANSDRKACLDCTDKPKPCSVSEISKFSSQKYCGVLNPKSKSSPLYKYIMKYEKSSKKQQENFEQMSKVYMDCLLNHCRIKKIKDHCHELETHVEEIVKDLNVKDRKDLDDDIRKYTSCKAKECPANSYYSSQYWVQCQATCGNVKNTVDCGNHRATGCVCDRGYFLNADMECVTEEECAKDCTVSLENGESFSLKNKQTVVVEACVKTITCQNGELIEKDLKECSIHAECHVHGTQCQCREGYSGDGHDCKINRTCIEGYTAVGDMCYKYVSKKTIWHFAAQRCGYEGARLARYDTSQHYQNLRSFLASTIRNRTYESSKLRYVYCPKNSRCRLPHNEHALSVYRKSASTCGGENWRTMKFESYYRIMNTNPKCYGKFIFRTTTKEKYMDYVNPKLLPWIGGNTEVMGYEKRKGLTPFNVDPPRLIDHSTVSNLGCYMASINSKRAVIIKLNGDCFENHDYICEYENHVGKPENPNDIIGLPQKVNWQEAQQKCKAMGRPLLKITNDNDLQKSKDILLKQLRGDAWIDAKFSYEKPYYVLRWNSDGSPLIYRYFKTHAQPKNYRKQLTLCIYSKGKDHGYWYSSRCNEKKYALCGPQKSSLPTVYTLPLPVPASSSLASIRSFIQSRKLSTSICNKPLEMKCRARREGKNGAWMSNFDQQGNTIVCTKEEISCKPGQGVDCKTLEVQFLCPQAYDQCAALKKLGVAPCLSGMICTPVDNHFNCLCPVGTRLNFLTRACENAKSCCSAWGDPHYTTFSGTKFDFMGDCKYLFAGSCVETSQLAVPHFNIYTKNVKCGKGSCLSKVEIHLRNLRIGLSNNKFARSGDYIFHINVDAATYKLDGKEMEQTNYEVPGAFKATVKKSYFSLDTGMGLRVTLSGSRLDVFAPQKPQFELCGLCQKLAQKLGLFTFKNGTSTGVGLNSKRKVTDYKRMAELASDYIVSDPESTDDECKVPDEAPLPCKGEVIKEIEAPNMCGVFTSKDSPMKECFDKIDPEEYFDDCKFDACVQQNRTEAVCAMAKAYAQACLKKGVIMDYRNEDFCPVECGEKEVWRSVASCEPTCGVDESDECDEEPEEGCVCMTGYKRQGQDCVPEVKCGCEIDMPDGSVWNMPIGKSILMPGCTENITCEEDEESKPMPITNVFSLPQNAICHNGPPTTVECSKGYQKTVDGKDCERLPGGCKEGYTESNGMCLDEPKDENIWRHAIQACSIKDSTLAHIDTEEKLNTIAKIMVNKKIKSMYIAGRVKAGVDGNKQIKLKPIVAVDATKIWYANYEVTPFLQKVAIPSDEITAENVETIGAHLSLMVRLSDGKEPIVVAVPTASKGSYVCEERDTKEDETEWRPACNTDTNMKDEGDQEYLKNMLLDSRCSVCPVPLAVRCKKDGPQRSEQTKEGKCALNKEGLLYNCEEGRECIDKAVETLCTKDIDECALGLHDCGRESTCVNTVGAYKCRCLNPNYPMMIDGFCQEARTCNLAGPQTPNGYIFNFTGFENVPGVFSYDCSYLLAAPKKTSYNRQMKLPYIDFALVQERTPSGLKMKVMGTIYSPQGKTPKAWMVDAEHLKEKTFMYGQDENMVKHELNYVSKLTGNKFIYKNPGVMMIIGLDNHYKARITMEPFSFQLQVCGALANIMDGVCTLAPEVPGENVFMSPKETEDISVGINRCKPFVEPPMPTLPPPTEATPTPPVPKEPTPPAPIVPTTIVPVTYGFPGGPPVRLPDRPQIPEESMPAPPVADEPPRLYPQPYCDPLAKDFCNVLAHACNIPENQCLSVLCSGDVCKCTYLAKEKFKYCNQTEELEIIIDELNCVEECDENERFAYSVASNQPTCSDPSVLPVEGEDAMDEWEFGCYCEQGFVLSGGDCVRKQECGCVLPDGSYVKPFSTWRENDCRAVLRCNPGGEIIAYPYPCGNNTQCVHTEDGQKCECEEGFFGNPEMEEGCQRGIPEDNGAKLCYNYTTSDGSSEERCNCSLGFISNCNDCEDIDECKLGLHDCDKSKEKCVNIPGGFECKCTEGYTFKNGECIDVDECKEKRDNCGQNAGCINKPGEYDCKCCAGYTRDNQTDDCVRDEAEFPYVPKNAQCCHVCNIPKICMDLPNSMSINYCLTLRSGDRIDFPSGEILFKYLCMHGLEYNQNAVQVGKCKDIPPIIDPIMMTTQIPTRKTTPYFHVDRMTHLVHQQTTTTPRPDDFYTYPEITTELPFPRSCEDKHLIFFFPLPSYNMRSGPVCGPLNSRYPETHESYEEMLRYVCRQVGGPSNVPRTSSISAFSGRCPTPPPTTTTTTTTYGAPFRPRTTTLGAPMRPQTTTLGAPFRPKTTTLGAPFRPPTTEHFVQTTHTRRPPTIKPFTTPRYTTERYTTQRYTTPFFTTPFYTTERHTTERQTTERYYTTPFPTTEPFRTTPHPTTEPYRPRTTMRIYYDTYEDIFGRPYRRSTTTYGPPAAPFTTTQPFYTTKRYTTPFMTTHRFTTERYTTELQGTEASPTSFYASNMPFPEGICEAPPILAVDATPDTPILFEVSYDASNFKSDQFKLFGVDADHVANVLKPTSDLLSTSTFSPGKTKAFIVDLPRGAKMEVPNTVSNIIKQLGDQDKVFTYVYRSYDAVVRVVTEFEVDRQLAYANIFRDAGVDVHVYDVSPLQDHEDVHTERGPFIISTHMGVRVALNTEQMCGARPPTMPVDMETTPEIQSTPMVRGCHSDYTGMTYRNGQSWSEGDCTNCTCDNGYSACYIADCFMFDCKHRQDVPGQCCDICLDDEPNDPAPEYTSWTPWSKCSFRYGHNRCGMGFQYRERDVDNSNRRFPYKPKQNEVYEERTCFEACKDKDGNIDTSKCPSEVICNYMDPVCGSTKPGPTTSFKSECNLNVQACHKGNDPIKIYHGMCDPSDDMPGYFLCENDGPIRTSVKYEYKDDMEECFGPVTDIKTCTAMLCEGGSQTCCQATEHEPIEVTVSCYSTNPRQFLRHKTHVHYSAVACKCQDKGKN